MIELLNWIDKHGETSFFIAIFLGYLLNRLVELARACHHHHGVTEWHDGEEDWESEELEEEEV